MPKKKSAKLHPIHRPEGFSRHFKNYIMQFPELVRFGHEFALRIMGATVTAQHTSSDLNKRYSPADSHLEYRRLDNLAHILLGEETCVALAYDAGHFYIACNNNPRSAENDSETPFRYTPEGERRIPALRNRARMVMSLLTKLRLLAEQTPTRLSFIPDMDSKNEIIDTIEFCIAPYLQNRSKIDAREYKKNFNGAIKNLVNYVYDRKFNFTMDQLNQLLKDWQTYYRRKKVRPQIEELDKDNIARLEKNLGIIVKFVKRFFKVIDFFAYSELPFENSDDTELAALHQGLATATLTDDEQQDIMAFINQKALEFTQTRGLAESRELFHEKLEPVIRDSKATNFIIDLEPELETMGFSKPIQRNIQDILYQQIAGNIRRPLGIGPWHRAHRYGFTVIEDELEDGVHAEVRVFYHFLRELRRPLNYIGISKLSCPHCCLLLKSWSIDIAAPKNLEDIIHHEADDYERLFRGWHGHLGTWPLASVIAKDPEIMQRFLGRDLMETYFSEGCLEDIPAVYIGEQWSRQRYYQEIIQQFVGFNKADLRSMAQQCQEYQRSTSYTSMLDTFKDRTGTQDFDSTATRASRDDMTVVKIKAFRNRLSGACIPITDPRFAELQRLKNVYKRTIRKLNRQLTAAQVEIGRQHEFEILSKIQRLPTFENLPLALYEEIEIESYDARQDLTQATHPEQDSSPVLRRFLLGSTDGNETEAYSATSQAPADSEQDIAVLATDEAESGITPSARRDFV